jgi:transposase-like protein
VRISDVALRHGVNRGLVRSWRRQAKKYEVGAEPSFVPIRIALDAAAPQSAAVAEAQGAPTVRSDAVKAEASASGSIDIEMGGVRVRVCGVVDAAALRVVLCHLSRAR